MRLNFSILGLVSLIMPPCALKNRLLRFLGWKIEPGCRIGFSWIDAKSVNLRANSKIGHGNIIISDVLLIGEKAYIGNLNRITGPLWVVLDERAGIGNQNIVIRANRGVTWGRAMFRLGTWSKITVGHVIDCTRSVTFGQYSILAGRGSQLWTHGYLHAPEGIDRFRIDGGIRVGDNVYIGSACILNAGVRVANAITIGAGSSVSRSLLQAGLYVSQPLRFLEINYELAYNRHPHVDVEGLVEKVVHKHIQKGS